jgi:outer membrane protein OmpA-like peptidoglycan-associated protein/Mg-chelatase subunit ChlD
MFKYLMPMLMILLLCGTSFAVEVEELLIESTKPETSVMLEQVIEDGKVLVRVTDPENKAVLGLTAEDFTVSQFGKQARIVSVESFAENIDVPRHIVLMLDNSGSMRQRNAVEPLLEAMDELLRIVRPIDQVYLVVFSDDDTQRMGGRDLHVRLIKSSHAADLKNVVNQIFRGRLTYNTFLYEGMLAGLEIVNRLPVDEPKFMVVFSDGEDLNSRYTRNDVMDTFQKLERFEAHTIDFMPGTGHDPFLKAFAEQGGGQFWKATEATSLVPIFQAVASKLQSNYVVHYLFPFEGRLAVSPASLTIEEIKTFDASPLLGHIYFEANSGDISQRYHRFSSQAETVTFNESDLRGTLDKYHHVLDIIGKRLRDNPDATITLVGCNADYGEEKGREDLSLMRAVAVRTYLQYIWSVDADRMAIQTRNLPEKPSTSRSEEGRADNRRVEIHSDHPAMFDLVRSTYLGYRFDNSALIVRPLLESTYGVADWHIRAASGTDVLAEISGEGTPADFYRLPLLFERPNVVGETGNIKVHMEVKDDRDQSLSLVSDPVEVHFLQTSRRLAQRLDYRVQERYALILFDFDSHSIDAQNRFVVDEIATRIRELPQAQVKITGHTDNIGSDAYNLRLSERRAKAVYDLLRESGGAAAAERIEYRGAGAIDPPYDNLTSEARAFNRTVIITLEYLARE